MPAGVLCHRFHLKILMLAAAGALAGCQDVPVDHARTVSGQDLGKREMIEISDGDSVMYILDAPRIRSIKAQKDLNDYRYQERIYLYPGYIFYEKTGAGAWRTDSDVRDTFFENFSGHEILTKKYGLVITKADVKQVTINTVDYAYLALQGANGVCFVFEAFFGQPSVLVGSLGDQRVNGGACYPLGGKSVAGLESEWLWLLRRLRFDGPKPGWTRRAAAPQPASVTASPVPPPKPRTMAADLRPIAVQWVGKGKLLAGTISLRDSRGSGTFSVRVSEGRGLCIGSYKMDSPRTGTWSVSCPDGSSANGTVKAYGKGKGSAGEGTDNEGNAVRFTVGGR